MRYRVNVTSYRPVSGHAIVEAGSAQEAERIALDQEDFDWIEDSGDWLDTEIDSVEEIKDISATITIYSPDRKNTISFYRAWGGGLSEVDNLLRVALSYAKDKTNIFEVASVLLAGNYPSVNGFWITSGKDGHPDTSYHYVVRLGAVRATVRTWIRKPDTYWCCGDEITIP